MRKIIGFCGRAGAGKSTAAAAVDGYRLGFSSALKWEVFQALRRAQAGARLAEFPGLPGFVYDVLLLAVSQDLRDPFVKPTQPTMRQLLQLWGTEYRRAQDEDYWVKRLDERLAGLPLNTVTIDDVRFPNEAAWVKANGGLLIHITRPGCDLSATEQKKHASENQVFMVDATIQNTGDVEELQKAVRAAVGRGQ